MGAGLGRWFRSIVRCVVLAEFLLEGGVELVWRRPATRLERAQWLHRYCARAMRRMGVTLEAEGEFPQSGALISNHVSYLDIVVFAALHPCVFVSKIEVVNLPIIGWMTQMSGTIFVERGHGGSALKAGQGMKDASSEGLPVVFFPEGTTNPERELLPFRSGLLGQVLAQEEPVTAAYVTYSLTEDNGQDVTVKDDIAWGEQSMFQHVFGFLGLRGVHATVRFADAPIAFSAKASNRKVAAVEARQAMLELVEARQTVTSQM